LKNVVDPSTLDNLAYEELKRHIDNKLTGKQRTILNMMLSPDVYIKKYKKTYKGRDKLKFTPSSLSRRTIGKLLGVNTSDIVRDIKKDTKKGEDTHTK